ncbi:hypothetical protein MASR1M101_10310 [Gemmatimonas sp.]
MGGRDARRQRYAELTKWKRRQREWELREWELREWELREWELREWELREWEPREWELREWELREWEPREWELREWEPREWELREWELREWELREWELREQFNARTGTTPRRRRVSEILCMSHNSVLRRRMDGSTQEGGGSDAAGVARGAD